VAEELEMLCRDLWSAEKIKDGALRMNQKREAWGTWKVKSAQLKLAATESKEKSKERAQAGLPMLRAIQEAFSSAAATNSE
jgi:hypothetical protein